jgi:hypothetical protein
MLVAVQFVEGETVAVVPLNLMVLVPCVEPKPVPVTVTEVPTVPEAGDGPVMLGVATTVNALPALVAPATVTVTFPVVAPAGTVAVMDVVVAAVTVAVVPLNLTVSDGIVLEKFVPVMVIEAPTAPEVGDRLVMVGAAIAMRAKNRNDKTNTPILHEPGIRRDICNLRGPSTKAARGLPDQLID